MSHRRFLLVAESAYEPEFTDSTLPEVIHKFLASDLTRGVGQSDVQYDW